KAASEGVVPAPADAEVTDSKDASFENSSPEHPFSLTVYPPSWRFDIQGPHDLVEEILRIKGYSEIPILPLPPLKKQEIYPVPPSTKVRCERQWIARRVLAARGLFEVVTWSFMKEEDARCFTDISP